VHGAEPEQVSQMAFLVYAQDYEHFCSSLDAHMLTDPWTLHRLPISSAKWLYRSPAGRTEQIKWAACFRNDGPLLIWVVMFDAGRWENSCQPT
jgi:hypothetical protein